MSLSEPIKNAVPFAASGLKNTIPVTSGSDEVATFTAGFPPKTMTPLNAGGVPPAGRDMNGILNQLSAHQVWLNAGGMYTFDSALATALGGYQKGAVIQSDDGLSAYICVVDGTTTDPNTVPLPAGWSPYGGDAVIKFIKLAQYDVDDVFMTFQTFADGAAVTTYFGGGTWARVPAGYITSAGTIVDSNSVSATFTAGVTSGENAHEITEAEMANHVHRMPITPEPSGAVPNTDQFDLGSNEPAPNFASVMRQDDGATLADNYTLLPLDWASAGDSEPMPLRPINTAMNFWRRTA